VSRQRPGLGIALIVLMAACFAALDNSIKYLGALMPLMFLLWWRYAFQAVAMGAWLFIDALRRPSTANGTSAGASTWLATASGTPDLDMTAGRLPSRWIAFHTAHPRFQALRGLLLLTTSALSFMGLRYMPVAEFTAINMLTPVGVTLLAGWVLHEHVSRLRWVLVMGACVGALIVIRPGSGLFGWAVFFPMAGALTYASFQVLTRRLAALESPYTTHFYTGLTGMLAMTPLLWFIASDTAAALRAASTGEIALVFAAGVLGTVGHLFLIVAFGLAPTSTLMPIFYVQIALAAALGWLLFRTVPDGWGWVGMGVIAVCGAASAWLNVRDAQQRHVPPPVGTVE
jgi:drug/metabolite transporter (DMT)-like permease